jgi:hypothetical protein
VTRREVARVGLARVELAREDAASAGPPQAAGGGLALPQAGGGLAGENTTAAAVSLTCSRRCVAT